MTVPPSSRLATSGGVVWSRTLIALPLIISKIVPGVFTVTVIVHDPVDENWTADFSSSFIEYNKLPANFDNLPIMKSSMHCCGPLPKRVLNFDLRNDDIFAMIAAMPLTAGGCDAFSCESPMR
ncbi:hypothetical protein ACHAXS_014448 [Conticribra weissflogii]